MLVATDFVVDALATYRALHPDVAQVVAADACRLPFADASFDVALCVTVLCHRSIGDPVEAVASSVASSSRAARCACGSPACAGYGEPTTG